ncbi:hypothetical protein BD324DRAFT_621947 [Kockovaella imperatae]|uniref:Uncharacterized protein n=1 Tax=Kockovaella imperatae TaxID=4999 RepID=A0A1Y1UME7_9TREE|nr:hypothetical protein BD324DRAFT_621947 [Kockovaella imperatae]ORX38687.1 hypothetical protein BD324DRAFT_621947 [Kockovaella imperatae]
MSEKRGRSTSRSQAEPSPASENPPRSTFTRIFRFFLYLIWIPVWLFIFVPLAIVMALPYTYIKSCRPHERDDEGHKKRVTDKFGHEKTKHLDFNPFQDHVKHRNLTAFPGEGPEATAQGFWRSVRIGVVRRTWDMYQALRGSWRMINRQGLQVGGVVSGLIIIIFQVIIMVSDLTNENVQKAFRDPVNYESTDPLCGYFLGSGVPNWTDVSETRVWYGFYHVHLGILAFMLILDELFNVRMGIFAPQWSRMGNGHTIMFLVSSTVTTSPHWGDGKFFRFRYIILVVLFLGGVYNWARAVLAYLCLIPKKDIARTYRYRRFPLRLWTEREWLQDRDTPPFRKHAKDLRKEKRRVEAAQKAGDKQAKIQMKKPKYWTERCQLNLGDRSVQLEAKDKNKYDFGTRFDMEGEAAVQTVYSKTEEQTQIEKGSVMRNFWLGNPTALPLDMRRDKKWLRDAARYSEYKHGAAFYGMHYWNPWEQVDEYNRRRKEGKQKQLPKYEHYKLRWHRKRYLTLFFDVRRWHSIFCALSMFAIHIALLIQAYNGGGTRWQDYAAQYDKATASWRSNGGPSIDDCQYYGGSTIPILVMYGVEAYSAIQQTMFWIVMWHIQILGMCIAVFLVALGNDRHWGMHLKWPVTLVGPRTSSISMGLTNGLIAWSTLQLGFFQDQPEMLRTLTRLACYNCVLSWAAHLFKNEYMKNVVCRRPFFRALTFYSFERMDSDKMFWEYPDYDED